MLSSVLYSLRLEGGGNVTVRLPFCLVLLVLPILICRKLCSQRAWRHGSCELGSPADKGGGVLEDS